MRTDFFSLEMTGYSIPQDIREMIEEMDILNNIRK